MFGVAPLQGADRFCIVFVGFLAWQNAASAKAAPYAIYVRPFQGQRAVPVDVRNGCAFPIRP